MSIDKELENLLSALTESFSDEELLLTALQSNIASAIVAARIKKELSQKELADALGVSQGLVSRWESGDANFTLQTLVRIALKLEIEMKSPYVSERPPRFYANGNVYDLRSRWASSVSSSPVWSQSNLEEM
ncbi:helix-turn-helix transcriptional regulator [Oscillibacter sp.]|uniref:helix-turn-helix domain-containing protein n=1 Tax=Oscillibacter sp. TaxID=1945593 RepID=UPI00289AB890|nr:helix-turn-helix transcriptional regulator [Oscillibacter sp.]